MHHEKLSFLQVLAILALTSKKTPDGTGVSINPIGACVSCLATPGLAKPGRAASDQGDRWTSPGRMRTC